MTFITMKIIILVHWQDKPDNANSRQMRCHEYLEEKYITLQRVTKYFRQFRTMYH